MKLRLFVIISVVAAIAAVSVFAQRPQADIKVTYRTTLPGGMQSESTTMIKGSRERDEQHMGYGMDQTSVKQCDLRRTIQISDKNRKYLITPMEDADSSATTAPRSSGSGRSGSTGPSQRGGVVTFSTTATDTGERKQMFGFTARHVKTTIRSEASADACNPSNLHMEQDGWYIDLNFGLNCETGTPIAMPVPSARAGGCRDRVRTRHIGTGRTGFPLSETTVGFDANGNETFRITKEVADLSRQPLDAALFDIPAGYTEAQNSQELMGTPDMNAMLDQAMGNDRPSQRRPVDEMPGVVADQKRPGTIRVGVVQINNKTDRSVSAESLRERLIGGIHGSNVEAIPLNATSASEADAEAKSKQCDFILFTDINGLKLSAAKALGGMLGRATGVGSGGIGKTESKIEYKLFPVGSSSPTLQSSASAKEEGDDASAGAAIDSEAKNVTSAVKKRG